MDLRTHLFAAVLAAGPGTAAWAVPTPINLGTASGFAVLAGSTVTNTGTSVVTGNLGVWPGTAVTGFGPGIVVNGQIYAGGAVAMQAETDAMSAYTAAAAETGGLSLSGQNLGGMTLTPGVYTFSTSAQLTGMLTLNAENLKNAVFIFQIGSTLTTAADAMIALINGNADDVIWQVGTSATLGARTQFDGDILAMTSIALGTGASIGCGGALALTGAVTLDDNSVSTGGSACSGGGTAVPEPPAFLLLAAACLGLAVARRGRGLQV